MASVQEASILSEKEKIHDMTKKEKEEEKR